MDGYVHLGSDFVNQKYKPMYPDKTLDKKVEKLCAKIDQLIDVNAKQVIEKSFFDTKPPPSKYPFWYLVVGIIVILYIYFKIKTPVNIYGGPPSVPNPSFGNRPGSVKIL
jgi:hypothetical protein